MMLVALLVVLSLAMLLAISLPFLLVQSDIVRRRMFLCLSAVPALSIYLMYWRGFHAYSVILLVLVFVLPVSLTLVIIGITLVVRARSRAEAWVALSLGTLLASIPLILYFLLIVVG